MSASREKKLRRELREAELSSDTVKKVKKQKKQMSSRQAQRLRSVIGTVVAVLVVLCLALLIFVNSGFLQTHATAATLGSHKLTPAEYNYFYQDAYNNIKSTYTSYGLWDSFVDSSKDIASQPFSMGEGDQTWGEYIQETALNNASQVFSLCDAAAADGYQLDQEALDSLSSIPDPLESTAKQAGFQDGEEYLESFYGKGAKVESYMDYLTNQEIAQHYAQVKSDSFSYSDEELRNYYDENKQDFDTVTYRVFNVATQDDDTAAAKATADDMASEVDGTEKSFSDAAYKYAPEDSKESYEDETYTLRANAGYSSVSTDYADWLFAPERAAGETQVFATSTGYTVVMFVSREDNHYNTVDVRHILIKVNQDADGNSTDEDWNACEEAINEILADWEASDMTEDTFAAMAEEKTEDTGSAENGGLYEDVYKGQMVTEFNDWCFEDGRKVGDYGVVKTTYGYHLIYFSGFGDEYWKTLADNSKRSADYDAWLEAEEAARAAQTSGFGMLFANKDLEA